MDKRVIRTKQLRQLYVYCSLVGLKEVHALNKMLVQPAAATEFWGDLGRTSQVLRYIQALEWVNYDPETDFWSLTDSGKPRALHLLGTTSSDTSIEKEWLEFDAATRYNLTQKLAVANRIKSFSDLSSWDFQYAENIKYIEGENHQFTDLGMQAIRAAPILQTYGSGYVDYLLNMGKFLLDPSYQPSRSFGEDTTGSAKMGDELWFDRAIEMLEPVVRSGKIESIVDVGCGNGLFLEKIRAKWPELNLVGIEFELERKPELVNFLQDREISLFEGSLTEPESIAAILKEQGFNPKTTLATTFHILQEVINLPGGSAHEVIEGFNRHLAGILICDMFGFPMKTIQKYSAVTNFPEIQLANALTGQVLLHQEQVEREINRAGFDPKELVTMIPFDRDEPNLDRFWLFLATSLIK